VADVAVRRRTPVTTMKTLLWVLTLSLIVGGAAWSVQLAFGDDGSECQTAMTMTTVPAPATAPASAPAAVSTADLQETP
jgi:hypothetical protein